MRFKFGIAASVIGCSLAAHCAQAQNASFSGLMPTSANNGPNGGPPPATVNSAQDRITVTSLPSTVGYGLLLNAFASEQDLAATQAQLGSLQAQTQLNATLGQLNTLASQINGMIAHERDRNAEGIALSAAMTIAPPNPGDRFSLTFTGAGYAGQGGGSVTGTYRIADPVMLFGGYARGATQNLVKAGVSFSFN
jgi:hypothetical protein